MSNDRQVSTYVLCSSSFTIEGIRSILCNSPFKVMHADHLQKYGELPVLTEIDSQLVIIVVHEPIAAETWQKLLQTCRQAKVVTFVSPEAMAGIPLMFLKRAHAVVDQDVDRQSLIEICQLVMNGAVIHSLQAFSWLFRQELEEQRIADLGSRPALPRSSCETAKPRSPDAKFSLSPRELSVLECLVNGSSNKVIARQFNLAEATVKIHVRSILRKLQTRNRTQAALWARENGISNVIQ